MSRHLTKWEGFKQCLLVVGLVIGSMFIFLGPIMLITLWKAHQSLDGIGSGLRDLFECVTFGLLNLI